MKFIKTTAMRSHSDLRRLMSSGSVKVSYQGVPGAYSEKAANELLKACSSDLLCVPHESFEDAFLAVDNKLSDYAIVPIENSLGGSIHKNFDLLLRYNLHIIAEHDFRVEHALLALPGVRKEEINRVLSHPQALAQCDNYIRRWGVQRRECYDTAGSAKMIRDEGLVDCAAIASDLAASTYGLRILDSNIEDDPSNFTRFLLLAREPLIGENDNQRSSKKTSIVFVLPNTTGSLFKALACFSLRDLDCSKVESRPTPVDLLKYSHDTYGSICSDKLDSNHAEKLSNQNASPSAYTTARAPPFR
jgi:prephenate dehydratase